MKNPAFKPKLLIAEDNPENQKLLQVYLSRKFKIFLCDSAETFYKLLEEDVYDLFLLDISLKGEKNGLHLAEELRKNPLYKNSPIICISAHVFPQDRDNAYKAGVDEFLPRPVFNQALLSSLIEIYKRKTGKNIE